MTKIFTPGSLLTGKGGGGLFGGSGLGFGSAECCEWVLASLEGTFGGGGGAWFRLCSLSCTDLAEGGV